MGNDIPVGSDMNVKRSEFDGFDGVWFFCVGSVRSGLRQRSQSFSNR